MIEQVYFFLKHHTLLILSLHLILILVFLALNFRDIKKRFSKIDRRIWIALLLIFVVGLVLRVEYHGFYSPTPVQEYSMYLLDENIWVNRCRFGSYEECIEYEKAVFPPGYPFLIVISYIVFGLNTLHAAYISSILGSLTIILVFLISYVLFKKEEISLVSAFIFSVIPLHIYFSHYSEPRVISLFFVSFTVLVYLIALKKDDVRMWILTALLLSYSIFVRQENSILLLLFVAGAFLYGYKFKKPEARKFIIPVTLFVLLQLLAQGWIIIEQPFGYAGNFYEKPLLSLSYFPPQSIVYFSIMFNNFPVEQMLFSPLASLLFIAGILLLPLKKLRREKIFVFSFFFIYFFFYSIYLYCAPMTVACEGHLRYTLTMMVPYSILAGYAVYEISNRFKMERLVKIGFYSAIIILVVLTSQIAVPETILKDERNELNVDGMSAINKTPNDCVILTDFNTELSRSEIIPDNRRKTMYITVRDMHYLDDVLRNSSCMMGVFYNDIEGYDNIDDFNYSFLFQEGVVKVYEMSLRPSNGG